MFPPRFMLPRVTSEDELRRRGFRCVEPEEFSHSNGSRFMVHAATVLAKVAVEDTEPGHRTYTVYYERGGTEELDEFDVMALVGEKAWRKLPTHNAPRQ